MKLGINSMFEDKQKLTCLLNFYLIQGLVQLRADCYCMRLFCECKTGKYVKIVTICRIDIEGPCCHNNHDQDVSANANKVNTNDVCQNKFYERQCFHIKTVIKQLTVVAFSECISIMKAPHVNLSV